MLDEHLQIIGDSNLSRYNSTVMSPLIQIAFVICGKDFNKFSREDCLNGVVPPKL